MKQAKKVSKSKKTVVTKKTINAEVVVPNFLIRFASCPAPVEAFVKRQGVFSSAVQLFSAAWIPTLMENYRPSTLSNNIVASPRKVIKIEPIDILFGRGNTINQHSGNALMRQIATINRQEYKVLYRQQKQMAADTLVRFMEKCGSRFLEVDSTSVESRSTYRTVEYHRVVEKFMQLLREIPITEKRRRQRLVDTHNTSTKDRRAFTEGMVRIQNMVPTSPHQVSKAQSMIPRTSKSHAMHKKPTNKENGIHVHSTDSIAGCSKHVVPVVDTAGLHHNTKKSPGLPLKKRILSRTLSMQCKEVMMGGGRQTMDPVPSAGSTCPTPPVTRTGSHSIQLHTQKSKASKTTRVG